MSPISLNQEPSNWTRLWGGVKSAGGIAEFLVGGSVAVGTSVTGIGAAAGGGVALHGIDTTIAGLRQLISGQDERSFTAQAIGELSGSQTTGDIADAGIGFFGSFSSAFSKVARGFSKISIPKPWKGAFWRFGELPRGVLGTTDPVGNIIIRNGLRGDDFQHVLKHESVHRWFSPGAFLFQKLRAQIGAAGYKNSEILRFSEEAIAEAYATGSIRAGVVHPLINGYGITTKGLATEGLVLGGVLEKSNELGQKLSNAL